MIKGNTVYFGFGDIYNDYKETNTNTLIFINIELPQKVGSEVDILHVKIVNELKVDLSYDELVELENKLESINKAGVIKIKDITLDFNNFNQRSVDAVLNPVKCLILNQLSLMAC